MLNDRGRRLGWAFGTIALVASLAGCVSMQDSGPPGSLQASPAGTTQAVSNIAPIPATPGPNLQPAALVSAFLSVSASYSTYPNIVKSYLTPQEAKAWNPKWSATVFSSNPSVTQQSTAKGKSAAKKVIVTVQGQVQATFSGTGQYLSVSQSSSAGNSCAKGEPNYTCEQFTLTQSGGQWRIAMLPGYLLLDKTDFFRVYQSQDLYFFDSAYPAAKVLVPDSIFVPLGTPAQQLLSTLVSTLIPPNGGGSAAASPTWLTTGAVTSIPPGTTLLAPVTILAGTATVNLGGTIAQLAKRKSIAPVLAQLTWTLIGSPTGSPGPITAVDLEINGTSQTATPQTIDPYEQYAPYPVQQGVLTYVNHGVAESLCGSSLANAGASVPVFGANGKPGLVTCGGTSTSPSPSPSATSSSKGTSGTSRSGNKAPANPVSMIAASPTGDYLAGVSPGQNSVSIWSLSASGSAPVKWSPPGQTINSISWDRQDDLWVVTHNPSSQTNSIYMVSAANGRAVLATFGDQQGNVISLSVAPDGVRVALIVQSNSGTQHVELAGIERANCGTGTGCRFPGSVDVALAQGPPLGGPSITDATSLAWYDKDNLYVVDNSQAVSELWEVPVTGQPPSGPYPVSVSSGSTAYAESIAADNKENVLVAGMSNGQLLISSGIGEAWQPLGSGSAPTYGVNP
jgi:Lipoprotein LpqB beta-propeller domain/Sporulation and spore germination